MKTLTHSFIRQRGAATLLTAITLMLLVTSVAVFSAKFATQDVKINANDYRSKQAEASAQAGIDHIVSIAYKQEIMAGVAGGSNSWSINDNELSFISGGNTYNVGRYSVTYQVLDGNSTDITANTLLRIESSGQSDDGVGKRKFEVHARFTPAFPTELRANLIAKGNVVLSNNSHFNNNESRAFLWTGGNVTKESNGQVLTNNDAAFTSSLANKPELLGGDPLFTTTINDNDKFFRSFFGMQKTVVKTMANVVDGSDPSFSSKVSTGGKFYWITGNATLSGTVGSATQPVVIVVQNDATLNLNNATVYGVIYNDASNWTNTNSGNNVINGGLVVNGNFTNSGKITVNFNDALLTRIPNYVGSYSIVSGSWREL